MDLIDPKKCSKDYYGDVLNPAEYLCTKAQHGKGTCHGDQGGPLMIERNGGHELIGITCWGAACGKMPDAYVNVNSKYKE